MNTIPEAAIPVRDLIRQYVPRPEELPVYGNDDDTLIPALRFGQCCPLGMLPGAPEPTPSVLWMPSLSPLLNDIQRESVREFYKWWDSLNDARAAVDAVWGEPEAQS